MLGYKHPYGEMARKKILSLCRDLENHLSMVFHRFISGEIMDRHISINLNCNEIEPWDPFARKEEKTQKLYPIIISLEHEGIKGEIKLEPYVLPHQSEFSSLDEFKRTSGPQSWNQQQGFYIYRANRMIQSGGWSGLTD